MSYPTPPGLQSRHIASTICLVLSDDLGARLGTTRYLALRLLKALFFEKHVTPLHSDIVSRDNDVDKWPVLLSPDDNVLYTVDRLIVSTL